MEGNTIRPWKIRLAGATIAAVCATILAIAAILTPSPTLMGTHEGLGLPPCGFLFSTGIPCPTCGMTTAFAYLMHGHPLIAFRSQPAGLALAVLTIAGAWLGLRAAVGGRGPAMSPAWWATGPGLATMGVIFFGGWAWKIADYLIHQTAR